MIYEVKHIAAVLIILSLLALAACTTVQQDCDPKLRACPERSIQRAAASSGPVGDAGDAPGSMGGDGQADSPGAPAPADPSPSPSPDPGPAPSPAPDPAPAPSPDPAPTPDPDPPSPPTPDGWGPNSTVDDVNANNIPDSQEGPGAAGSGTAAAGGKAP